MDTLIAIGEIVIVFLVFMLGLGLAILIVQGAVAIIPLVLSLAIFLAVANWIAGLLGISINWVIAITVVLLAIYLLIDGRRKLG